MITLKIIEIDENRITGPRRNVRSFISGGDDVESGIYIKEKER